MTCPQVMEGCLVSATGKAAPGLQNGRLCRWPEAPRREPERRTAGPRWPLCGHLMEVNSPLNPHGCYPRITPAHSVLSSLLRSLVICPGLYP